MFDLSDQCLRAQDQKGMTREKESTRERGGKGWGRGVVLGGGGLERQRQRTKAEMDSQKECWALCALKNLNKWV